MRRQARHGGELRGATDRAMGEIAKRLTGRGAMKFHRYPMLLCRWKALRRVVSEREGLGGGGAFLLLRVLSPLVLVCVVPFFFF